MRSILSALLISVAAPSIAFAQQLAFPTAEGFGKHTLGGRGGAVHIVSNLNDGGAGSLRACAEATGPRTCVFRIVGEIRLNSKIDITSDFLTIAGQTAPGGGVMLTSRDTPNLDQLIRVAADHVIIRHIRLLRGPPNHLAPNGEPSSNTDAILIEGSNVIVDHSSFAWGADETFNEVGQGGNSSQGQVENPKNLTVQWSQIFESLRNAPFSQTNHSRSTYFGYGVGDLTIHHSLIASSTRRNPNTACIGQFDFINNVTYNADQYAAELYNRHGTCHYNWVGSVAQRGPSSPVLSNRHAVNIFKNEGRADVDIHVAGNLDWNRPTLSGDEKLVLDPKDWIYASANPVGYGVLSLQAASITSADQAYKDVLAFSGPFPRDTTSARVVGNVQNCTGAIIDDPSQVGGWPVLAGGTAPTDADNDGMADAWETANGLTDKNADKDGDGYTNLEEYLNELAGDQTAAGVTIIKTGSGTGAGPNPKCGATIQAATSPTIHSFTVTPASVAPGGTVTIAYDVENPGGTCNSGFWSFPLAGQALGARFQGSVQHTMSSAIGAYEFDFTCQRSKVDDWANRYVFVTASGAMPALDVVLTASKTSLAAGEAVTLSWREGAPLNTSAEECVAIGAGFDGFEPTTGSRTFVPPASGIYKVRCTRGALADEAMVTLTVGGSPPPVPPVVSIAISPPSQNEGTGSTNTALYTFTVTRTGDITGSSTVDFDEEGTGSIPANGSDFGGAFKHGIVSFGPGEAVKQRFMTAIADNAAEQNEAFRTVLSNPIGATIGTASAAGTLINDDGTSWSITGQQTSVVEGNSGPTQTFYTVSRIGSAYPAATISFATAGEAFGGNPAASCADFPSSVCPSGVLSFALGEVSKTLGVNVRGETTVEPNEGFAVTISAPSDGTVGGAKAQVTIINDDSAGGSGGGALALGANVEISRSPYTQIRSAPQGAQAGTQLAGADGQVIGGPVNRNAIDWWQVDFVAPPDGWVEAKYLRLR